MSLVTLFWPVLCYAWSMPVQAGAARVVSRVCGVPRWVGGTGGGYTEGVPWWAGGYPGGGVLAVPGWEVSWLYLAWPSCTCTGLA